MKTSIKELSTLFFCLGLLIKVYSQQNPQCSTPEMNQKFWDANPELRKQFLEQEQQLEALDKAAFANGYKDNDRALTIYTYPVVFHIIHQNGPENVSDAQILDGLRILNEDFKKLNADTANTVAAFKSIAANCGMEFCLATKDPNGNPTSGIDRIVSSTTNNAGDNARLNIWDANKYLNIWIVASIGTSGSSGFTYYPQAGISSKDGVMLRNDFLGSIGTSRVRYEHDLTHEVGHYFNLFHTFDGGSTSVCGDDGVSDTPPSKQHNYINTCPGTNDASCGGGNANLQNYMDYTFCYTMFTAGQVTRMRNIAATSTYRKNLWTTANLIATGCASTTGIGEELSSTIQFNIYPNPVEENTIIKFNLTEKQKVQVRIYDVIGQDIASVVSGELNSGEYEYAAGKTQLSSGIYFVKLTVGDQSFTKKMIVK